MKEKCERHPGMGHVGIWLEITDDNDTSAEQKHGSQGSAWGMLRREKVPQGVRRSAGPVLHTPAWDYQDHLYRPYKPDAQVILQ